MFAHQVVEALKGTDLLNEDLVQKLINSILNSQKFHLGDGVNFGNSIFSKSTTLADILIKYEKYLKMPYSLCWVDFSLKQKETDGLRKAGMLSDFNHEENTLTFLLFGHFGKHWDLNAAFGKFEFEDKSIALKYLTYDHLAEEVSKISDEDKEKDFMMIQHHGLLLLGFMVLLNCKNVYTEVSPDPAKLNKKRQKVGKVPIFQYKTLFIRTKDGIRYNPSTGKTGIKHAVHLCRGHFKRRSTGVFWWDAHVRGDKKRGIVVKDYAFEEND